MVEIFTGSGLGLERSSATILGNAGTLGNAATGTADAGVSVNATTGNLVIQAGGETLSGVGDSVELDAAVGQTYNSLGLLNAANNTTWEAQGAQILNPTGTLNTAGSTVQRLGWDGSLVTYTWQANYVNTDTTTGAYVVKEGAGPYDSITNVSGSWFWHDGSTGVTEAYAHTNNVVSSRYDLNGNTLNYTYNAANQITRMTTSDGEYINLTYSGANLVQLTTYGSGGATLLTRTSYGYDSANRLTSTTVDLTPADNSTADGNVYTTTYTYVVPASQVSSNPATANLIASVKQTDGSEVDFTYDSSNRVSSITQWVNSTTSRTTTFTYGSVTTTSGSTAISYAGGALYAGEVISGTGIPAGTTIASVNATSSTGGTAVLSAAATASGTIAVDTTVTDPQGNKTVLTYDAKGELLSVASPAAQNGTSEFRSYTYDSNGNVLTESVYANVGNAPSGSPISQLTNTYDPNGNLASTIDLAGDETSYTYNQFNEALTKTVYTVPKQGSTAASGAETTFYVYDAHGRLNFTVSQAGDVTYNVVNTLGQTTSTLNYTAVLYSTAGLTASTPIALATMTTWQAGLTSAQKAAVERTDYTYDARGNLTTATTYSATDANGNGLTTSPYTKTTYVYDQAGELISKLLNDGSSAQAYVYDGLGRITLQTDAAGKSTQNTYNNAANTKTVTYANGLVDTLSYDKAGELVSSVNTGSGIATTAISYIYDSIGNLRVSTDPAGINTYYFYDADGRKTGQVDGAGFLTEYKYDAANRLTATVTYTATLSATQLTSLAPTSGVPSAVSLTAIQPLASPTDDWNWTVYNAAGQVSQTINAVGSVAAYTYDGTGAVTQTTQYANELTSAQLATLIENTPGQNVLANPGFNGTTGWSDWSGTLTTGTQNSLNYIQGTMTSTAQYQSNEVANVFAVTAGQQLNIQAGVGAAGVVGYVELAVTWRDVNGNIITVGGNQIQVVGAARNGAQAYNTQISGSVTAPTGAVSATFGIYFSASGAGSSTFQLIEPTVTIANATLSPVTVTPNSASDRTTRNFYNADGLLIGSLDARGYLTQIDYDDAGQKVDTVAYANLVSPSLLVSGTFSQLQASVGSSSRDQHSYVIYDGRGLVAATIDPMGNLTRYTYTARGEVATKVTGQQVTANTVYTLATLPVATGAVETTAYTYDGDGRVLTQTLGQGTSQQTTTTYTYDAVGNVLTVTNGNAYTTTSTYDALGRVLQISQAIDSNSADNIVTKYTYDTRGNRTSVTDGRGNTTYSYYDGDDRLVLSVDADGFATRTAYYATGQVASV
ncbi:hypothetical protein, partial [Telmatospirillum sp.]|uniref:hypothetical protein n=1 Tax=Telmatospirillum sp. TaxID=2079197 RepID=UPI00284D2B7B